MSNPYDIRIAFDDLFQPIPVEVESLPVDQYVLGLVESVYARRIPVAAYDVRKTPREAVSILGAEQFTLPRFGDLRRRFATAMTPSVVRMDTMDTYRAFRTDRATPYQAQLDARLAKLEEAFRRHGSDGHGGDKMIEAFDVQVIGDLAQAAKTGGTLVETAVLPGKIVCWQDGSEILCTGRGYGLDRKPRYITASIPTSVACDEVLGAAVEVDVPSNIVIPLLPQLTQQIGARIALSRMCTAAPVLEDGEVAVLQPQGDPDMAAAMALLQQCRLGDPQACAEANVLRSTNSKLMDEATNRYNKALKNKAKGR